MTPIFRTATATVEGLLREVQRAQGVSTDTRDVLEGLVFWALKGDRFDGNDFVEAALAQGAAHIVSNRQEWQDEPRVTVVADVLDALQATARALRRTWDCPVLALTGSNGKTTTKELLRDVMAEGMEVHATSGNFNNHIGVPLTLLRAPAQPEFVVVEMGANHQQEIALLCAIAEPSHGCITNIGLAHLEGFGGEEGVQGKEGTVRPPRGHTRHGLRQHGRSQSGACFAGCGSESPHLARRLEVDPFCGRWPNRRRQPKWRLLWCAP